MQLRDSCWGKEAGLHPGSCGHLLVPTIRFPKKENLNSDFIHSHFGMFKWKY